MHKCVTKINHLRLAYANRHGGYIMNLADMDMKKEFEEYNKLAPVKTVRLNGGDFAYRYYKNPNPKVNVTLLVLAGGTGLAEGMFAMAKSFMDKYSLISFNYPMAFQNNEATADAIYELIKYLKAENVYLWGQSYGGLLAQIIAKRHPDAVKGLILTSTASFSNDIRYEGMRCLSEMISEEKEKKRQRQYKRFPMFLLPAIMGLAFKKHLKNEPEIQKAVKELMNQIKGSMTNAYFVHMDTLLGDLRNHFGTHHKEDFAFLKGRVLIIEPEDDKTFTEDIKDALVNIMTEPKVVRDMQGGHLAIMLSTDETLQIIDEFFATQKLDETEACVDSADVI